MSIRPTHPARRWPAAEWWAPLLKDLAAIQRGSASMGLLLGRIDLTGSRPSLEATWPDGTCARLSVEPEAGVPVLLESLRTYGPATGPPKDHDEVYWAPGSDASPLLINAWLLDELGSQSDAWYAYTPARVELLAVRTDGRETVCVGVGRHDRRDAVWVRARLSDFGEPAGFGYAVVERAATAHDPELLPQETIGGLPTFLLALHEN